MQAFATRLSRDGSTGLAKGEAVETAMKDPLVDVGSIQLVANLPFELGRVDRRRRNEHDEWRPADPVEGVQRFSTGALSAADSHPSRARLSWRSDRRSKPSHSQVVECCRLDLPSQDVRPQDVVYLTVTIAATRYGCSW